jgi:hypothetical protein
MNSILFGKVLELLTFIVLLLILEINNRETYKLDLRSKRIEGTIIIASICYGNQDFLICTCSFLFSIIRRMKPYSHLFMVKTR